MRIIISILLFLFGMGSVSALEQLHVGKGRDGFRVVNKNNEFMLTHNGKVILSRSGSEENWLKYSSEGGGKMVECPAFPKLSMLYLQSGSGITSNNILEKKNYWNCLHSFMSKIYYVSEKMAGRYYIIGVGMYYPDFSGGMPVESYIFDAKTGKITQIHGLLLSKSLPEGFILREGKNGIYITNGWEIFIVDNSFSQIKSIIGISNDPDPQCERYNTKFSKWRFAGWNGEKRCIDFQDEIKSKKTEIYSEVEIYKMELLTNKRLKLFVRPNIERDTNNVSYEKIISLK